jgi:ribosomal protein S17E
MRGIIGTTLSFAAQDSQRQTSSSWRFSNINAFYLPGQGAVFVIPKSGLRGFASSGITAVDFGPEFYQSMENMTREVEAQTRDVAIRAAEIAARLSAEGTAMQSAQAEGAPPAAPAPPAPPAPPQPAKREAARELMEEYRKKAKQNREEAKAKHEEYLKNLSKTKDNLIEALASYGDSMTTVKPHEYINLVLATDDPSIPWDQRPRHDVISAQKSWIADYRAGKLTLDAFKAKLIRYAD